MIHIKTKKAPVLAKGQAGNWKAYSLFSVLFKAGVMRGSGNGLLIALMMLCGFNTRAVAQEQQPACSMDFVYSGGFDQAGDSLFFLCYTFPAEQVRNLNRFVLEDARGQYRLILNKPGMQGDMEVKNETERVRVIVHRYERSNLPVLVKGEDASGTRHEVYIRTAGGERISGEQLRLRIGKSPEPSPGTGPVPMQEPDPSLKNPNSDMP